MTNHNEQVENPESNSYGLSVLLATPQSDTRACLSAVFQALGCDVSTTRNGLDTVNQLSIHSFDLLIVDYQMQPITGISIANKVKNGLPNIDRNIVILGLVDNENKYSINECQKAGMADVITALANIDNTSVILNKFFPKNAGKKTKFNLYKTVPTLDDNLAANYLGANVDVAKDYRLKYIATNTPLVIELQQALLERNKELILHITHKLKSSSLFIGAKKLHLLCKETECLTKKACDNDVAIQKTGEAIIKEFSYIETLINSKNKNY